MHAYYKLNVRVNGGICTLGLRVMAVCMMTCMPYVSHCSLHVRSVLHYSCIQHLLSTAAHGRTALTEIKARLHN